MPAFECDLKRVLADQRDVLNAQLVRVEVLDASQTSWGAGLAATLCAGTGPAEALRRKAAAMAILPRDDHDLAFAVDIDGEWIRVGVFQLLVTGR